jgi:hypothetical protein
MLTYCTYAALSRSACALPLNLIWNFETTSILIVYHNPKGLQDTNENRIIGDKNTLTQKIGSVTSTG